MNTPQKLNIEEQVLLLKNALAESDIHLPTKKVKQVYKEFLENLHIELIKGKPVSLLRMGVLQYKTCPAFTRKSIFAKNQEVNVPERKILKFKPAQSAKIEMEKCKKGKNNKK